MHTYSNLISSSSSASPPALLENLFFNLFHYWPCTTPIILLLLRHYETQNISCGLRKSNINIDLIIIHLLDINTSYSSNKYQYICNVRSLSIFRHCPIPFIHSISDLFDNIFLFFFLISNSSKLSNCF